MRAKAAFLGGLFLLLVALPKSGAAVAPDDSRWLGPRQNSFLFDVHFGGYVFESGESIGGGETNQLDVRNSGSLGLRFGYSFDRHWETELNFDIVPTDSPTRAVNFYHYALNVNYNFLTEMMLVPYLFAGAGAATWDPVNALTNTDPLLNYGGGLRIFFLPGFAFRLDVRVLHTWNPFNTNFAFTFGLNYYAMLHRYRDSDGDGIFDRYDQAPTQAEDLDGFRDQDGVPDPDNDGDGINDVRDRCPNTREDFDRFQDDDGCPDHDQPAVKSPRNLP